ncbi:MAG: hypothetical protein LBR80_17065 [Deltaproteobacteria bacterium]|jgi:hypothetical protein|nr:hypothetical protein [Deltaproteobacteria bacterium]
MWKVKNSGRGQSGFSSFIELYFSFRGIFLSIILMFDAAGSRRLTAGAEARRNEVKSAQFSGAADIASQTADKPALFPVDVRVEASQPADNEGLPGESVA